jgi:hypothetical protein
MHVNLFLLLLLSVVVVCMHASVKSAVLRTQWQQVCCSVDRRTLFPPSPQVAELSQEVRDHVGTCLLRLTLRELYDWRFMQTDPNWGNFLYDQQSGVLNLIDFGAAKQYPRR